MRRGINNNSFFNCFNKFYNKYNSKYNNGNNIDFSDCLKHCYGLIVMYSKIVFIFYYINNDIIEYNII